jgi:hypothetical protein
MLQYIENGSSTLEEGESSQNKLAGERIGFGRGQAPTSQFLESLCNLLLFSKLASFLACLGMSDAIFIYFYSLVRTAYHCST